MVRPGYMRIVNRKDGRFRYLSFREYYGFDESQKRNLYQQQKKGIVDVFCACNEKNILSLTITSNYVIRVSENKMYDKHMKSCPKSEHYERWLNLNNKEGVRNELQDGQMAFKITLPSPFPPKLISLGEAIDEPAGEESACVSEEEKKERRVKSEEEKAAEREKEADTVHRVNLKNMVTSINKMAWERQTFSIKKQIHLCKKEQRPVTWEYKSSADFIRLIYGISHDITIMVGSSVGTLSDICYNRTTYYQNEEPGSRYFIYAEIEKLGEFKESRKYQYITLRMSSPKSASRTAIRVRTPEYNDLILEYKDDIPGTKKVLAGYVTRNIWRKDGQESDWMTLLQGCIFLTSENGLICNSAYEASVANALAEKKILFKAPYIPLENYGNFVPTFQIERLRKKDMLIDIVTSKRTKTKILSCVEEDNPEFDFQVFVEDDEDIFDSLDM